MSVAKQDWMLLRKVYRVTKLELSFDNLKVKEKGKHVE